MQVSFGIGWKQCIVQISVVQHVGHLGHKVYKGQIGATVALHLWYFTTWYKKIILSEAVMAEAVNLFWPRTAYGMTIDHLEQAVENFIKKKRFSSII